MQVQMCRCSEVQWWCRGAERFSGGAEVQRGAGAEVKRSEQRCRAGANKMVQSRCKDAEVQRYR